MTPCRPPRSRKLCRFALMAGLAAMMPPSPCPGGPESVFEMPGLHGQHQQLARQMIAAMRQNDDAAMEQACRAGVELLPRNPVWRYNLACALARQGRVTEALETLERAIALGFRDADMMAGSDDLAPLRQTTRFGALLQTARDTADQPVPGEIVKRPLPVIDRQAVVSESNTVWNLDMGYFQARFSLPEAPAAGVVAVDLGAAGERVNRWHQEGTAAGNHGDYYDNRDDGHSAIKLESLPQVTRIVYAPEARLHQAHWGLSRFHFPNAVVVGNSSSARTGDAFWRSIPRLALTEGQSIALLVQHYTDNHLYVYPSHHDFRPGPDGHAGHGDTFFANTPLMLIARGSSYTDKPLIEAAFLALAALRPEVKTLLRRNHLLMPTLQMLLRQAAIDDPLKYLTVAAHPVCFAPDAIDPLKLVEMAQSITTNRVPPLVQLRMADRERMQPGRDFFDAKTAEGLFDTPFALARVMRGMPFQRHYRVSAEGSRDLNGLALTFHWRVLQGDPDKIRITPLNDAGSAVDISLDYHTRFPVAPESPITSTRVDIGVFAHNGHYYSAPAMISFFYLDNEQRLYRSDGRILSVDYAAARDRYVDPQISLPRNWRDDYRFGPQGQFLGWIRLGPGGVRDYTPQGFRVERKDRQGRPLTARAVQYVVRSEDDNQTVPEIVELPGTLRVRYDYVGDDDLTGNIVHQEHLPNP